MVLQEDVLVYFRESSNLHNYVLYSPGDSFDIHSDKFICVLPTGGGDHSPHLACCTSSWQISNICYDTSFIKVKYLMIVCNVPAVH